MDGVGIPIEMQPKLTASEIAVMDRAEQNLPARRAVSPLRWLAAGYERWHGLRAFVQVAVAAATAQPELGVVLDGTVAQFSGFWNSKVERRLDVFQQAIDADEDGAADQLP